MRLPEYYATADIFVGPSVVAEGGDREGLGLVFVEALACGCSVVCSDLPAISDIIADNETGFVVRQKSHADIHAKVVRLLNDRKLRESLQDKGMEFVQNQFDWKIIGAKFARVLNDE